MAMKRKKKPKAKDVQTMKREHPVCPQCKTEKSFMSSGAYFISCMACGWTGDETAILEFMKINGKYVH